MEYNELLDLIKINKQKIVSNKILNAVLDKSNRLISIEAINRILIALQRDNCTQVYTKEWVDITGVQVRDDSKPIYIIGTQEEKIYIDVSTGDIADVSDLSISELQKAVEIGIIKPGKNIIGYDTIALIDKRDIILENCEDVETTNSKIDSSDLPKIFKSVTRADIIETDRTYYDISSNILYMHKDTITDRVIANSLFEFIKNNRLNSLVSNQENIRLNGDIERLLEQFIKYELITAFGIKEYTDFKTQCINKYSDLIEIINIADMATYEVVESINGLEGSIIENPDEVAKKINQCIDMLTAMQANSIYAKLKFYGLDMK